MDTQVQLRGEMLAELEQNILPFWMDKMVDRTNGGFYGRITGTDVLMPEAEKGAVLIARILWTFSAAYRLLGKKEYLETAIRAKHAIINEFYDHEFGGVYWSLHYTGRPLDTKKQIYALGFAIYGLSEYHRATGDAEALTYAVRLFESIERHSFDSAKNGYWEAMARDWGELADMRLSAKDANVRKTMNTHLHILEPYTHLYRVWKNEKLERRLRNLLEVFASKIVDAGTGHLNLFFNDDWQPVCPLISYGHDIEASWLIHEAALVLGDKALLTRVEPLVKAIARAAGEGITSAGGMRYEFFPDKGAADTDYHWWVQAENVVGHLNLYQHFGDKDALRKAVDGWEFIKGHLIDREGGEWHWSVDAAGTVNCSGDKAGFWKCPYHNGRMCMEVIERFS